MDDERLPNESKADWNDAAKMIAVKKKITAGYSYPAPSDLFAQLKTAAG